MLTDKERMELMNLRKRVAAQREELKHLRELHDGEMSVLRSRCYPGAERYFDSGQYGLIKIVTVRD